MNQHTKRIFVLLLKVGLTSFIGGMSLCLIYDLIGNDVQPYHYLLFGGGGMLFFWLPLAIYIVKLEWIRHKAKIMGS